MRYPKVEAKLRARKKTLSLFLGSLDGICWHGALAGVGAVASSLGGKSELQSQML